MEYFVIPYTNNFLIIASSGALLGFLITGFGASELLELGLLGASFGFSVSVILYSSINGRKHIKNTIQNQ
ncbi:hypothetical protein GZ78_14630 [Endozoicomonas numazuensis]|uniref:Uncharacterized protein n=1 Tax=Endozoicomonas numazuensis TaxID=1137799 RepID=A0A081NF84_9GAMM|nr:hypothetical protein GZ78_14630 [Endozoicomonas numazuensis]